MGPASGLEFTNSAKPAASPRGPFCLRLPNAGILSVPYCVQLLNASSGNQTQVFVLARQALTNRAILPAHGGPPCYTVQD